MSAIFGGSKSRSRNVNNDALTGQLTPLIQQGVNANTRANTLLSGDATEFNNFKRAVGFDFELARGLDQLGSASSGRGVFRSGARDKAVQEFGNNLQNRFAQQYLQTLLGQSQQALGAGGILASTGQESTSSSTPGLAGMIGGLASGAASLKSGGLFGKGKAGLGDQ